MNVSIPVNTKTNQKNSKRPEVSDSEDFLRNCEGLCRVFKRFDAYDFQHFDTLMIRDFLTFGVSVMAIIVRSGIPADWRKTSAPLRETFELFLKFLDRQDGFIETRNADSEAPGRRFIQAFESVCRILADGPMLRRGIEPVHELLHQFRNYDLKYVQIARMYGRYNEDLDRFEGPFLHPENGRVMEQLIEAEGREPGSVVPVGYNPQDFPMFKQLAADRVEFISISKAFVKHFHELQGQPVDKDPASVEELLREGQFPDVIAQVKAVSEESVRAKAAELGIKIKERDDILQAAYLEYQETDAAKDSVYQDAMNSQPSTPSFDRAGFDGDEKPTEASQDQETPDDSESDSESEESKESLGTLSRDDLYVFLSTEMAEDANLNASSAVRKLREQKIEASAITVGRLIAQIKAEAAEV